MNISPISLPLGFEEWLPLAQAATLGLLTFLQEDLPTVSAALLAAAGVLSWQIGFFGVFLGIWIGDALLYALARMLGRPILQQAWAQRFLKPEAVARSEQWFTARGTWLLFSSRFIPGTRLPTYLAAGFLRLPFGRFLLVTGLAVAVWTISVFILARFFGAKLLQWISRWNSSAWSILFLILGLVLAVRLGAHLTSPKLRLRLRVASTRWAHWEFWPAWLFYLPVALNYVWLALRYRGFTVPTAANPGIFSGGFVGESKIATLLDLQTSSPEFTAEAYLVPGTTLTERRQALDQLRAEHHLDYPFILKPDIGQRGVGVKLIRTPEQAAECLAQLSAPLIVQRYAPGPYEIGVFYYRFPHQPQGKIFAITEKIFPIITGDGQRTIEELVWQDDRARFLAEKYLSRVGNRRSEVLSAGKSIKLVEAGNHAQGCIFRNGTHLGSAEFERRIDEISQRLNGFFIGRYDIRYASPDELRQGRNFQIIELNGAASEATSIYDAQNSLLSAYRTLFRQWNLVFAIGSANRHHGSLPTPPALLWKKWRETSMLVASYPMAD